MNQKDIGVPRPIRDFCFPAPGGTLFRCLTTSAGSMIHHVGIVKRSFHKTKIKRFRDSLKNKSR